MNTKKERRRNRRKKQCTKDYYHSQLRRKTIYIQNTEQLNTELFKENDRENHDAGNHIVKNKN